MSVSVCVFCICVSVCAAYMSVWREILYKMEKSKRDNVSSCICLCVCAYMCVFASVCRLLKWQSVCDRDGCGGLSAIKSQ